MLNNTVLFALLASAGAALELPAAFMDLSIGIDPGAEWPVIDPSQWSDDVFAALAEAEAERKRLAEQREAEEKRLAEEARRAEQERIASMTPHQLQLERRIAQAEISTGGTYIGPDYVMPRNLQYSGHDSNGVVNTYDNARSSMTVKWKDFFGLTHAVTVQVGQSRTVVFPSAGGQTWEWRDGDGWQKTVFNPGCKWVTASFTGVRPDTDLIINWGRKDDYVRISAQCFKEFTQPDVESLKSQIREYYGDTAEILGSVDKIAQTGVNDFWQLVDIYTHIESAKRNIPPQL